MTSTLRRLGFVLVMLLTLAIGGAAAAEVIDKKLVLTVGQQEVIDARKVKSYSVGDRDHVEVRLSPDGTKLIVVARKAGSTSLLLLRDCGDDVRFTIDIAR
jgi:hypothetical protein